MKNSDMNLPAFPEVIRGTQRRGRRVPGVEMGHMVLPAEPIGTVAHAC